MRQKKLAYWKHGIAAGGGLSLMIWGSTEALPLLIWIGLALIAYNGFKIFKVKRAPEVQEDPLYRSQDEEHSKEIAGIQRSIALFRVLFGIVCIASVVLLVVVASGGSIVPLIAVASVGAVVKFLQSSREEKLKTYVAENITRQALEEVFEVTSYSPLGCMDRGRLKGSHFGIGDFDKAAGSDYVKGFYNGLPIEMCDLLLTKRETRTNEDGTTEEYDVTVFKGFWLICDFGKELSADLCLWERGKLGKVFGGGGIKTENESFNKRFRIESEIEVEAFYILTPHMMEYILEMDRKAEGDTHMRFERAGRVHIAIGGERDAFEVGKKTRDATQLRRQFVEEIRYITDLIDELRLVDTLCKK